jgi:hypothetical protein
VNVSTHVSRGSTEDVVLHLLPTLRQSAASVEADLHAAS